MTSESPRKSPRKPSGSPQEAPWKPLGSPQEVLSSTQKVPRNHQGSQGRKLVAENNYLKTVFNQITILFSKSEIQIVKSH